jgi:hypothetical protein
MFRTAGGSVYTFAHPFLTGQLASVARALDPITQDSINEVDITRSLRLNDQFFNAQSAQPNSLQEVMVDGSTITITNHLMNGRMTLQVVPGTGLVRDGDLTAIAPFIVQAKDNVGGILTRRRFTSVGAITRVYYGVSFSEYPHDVDVGNAVPIYPMVLLYGGWIEGLLSGVATEKVLWAVGNQYGLRGNYEPFNIAGVGPVHEGGISNEAAWSSVDGPDLDDDSLGEEVPDANGLQAPTTREPRFTTW